MQLEVIKNGVYPINFNENGNEVKINYKPEELIQTSGLFLGTPSLFLNLGLCNLKCVKREFVCNNCQKQKGIQIETQLVANIIRNNIGNVKHLVITGGEPFLQVTALLELLSLIEDLNLFVTIETNGTIFNQELYDKVNYISIYPILSVFTPAAEKLKGVRKELKSKEEKITSNVVKKHEKDRVNIPVLQKFIDNVILDNTTSDTNKILSLNVYILSVVDIIEFKNDFLNQLENWTPEDINIIYYGMTENLQVIYKCKEEGFNFIPLFNLNNSNS